MRKSIGIAVVCGVAATLVVFGIHLRDRFTHKPAELLVFAIIGNRPFADSISSIWPDGSRVERILTPKGSRSYLEASGNSLSANLVVAVHESKEAKDTVNHLYLYHRLSGTWKRMTTMEGAEGYGAISPDDSRVVFEFEPQAGVGEKRGRARLWMVELDADQPRQLTTDEGEGTWDTLPSWRPDGEEITFIRCRISGAGVITKLMRVSSKGGAPTVLAEGIVDATYSPDGKRMAMVATGGLIIWDPAKDERIPIVPWSKLPNHKYLAVGLTWSRSLDRIAFSSMNQSTGESELWTVSSDGTSLSKLHSTKAGRISFPTFIRTQ